MPAVGRQESHLHRNGGRPARGRAHGMDIALGRAGTNVTCRQATHLPLTRSHAYRGIALQRLDAVETFSDCVMQVLFGNVLTDADKCFAARLRGMSVPARTCGCGRRGLHVMKVEYGEA